ncbi:MAG TPA: TonB-dependent receptor [Lacibacter sp.]|nr:TonB-dependent receptor [Lacibacter sp.]HMO87944.1 TonB-dependent receptor [Lacibacter sp.]
MVKQFVIFFAVQLMVTLAYAQPCTFRLSGVISDIDTKIPLGGATITIRELNRSVVSGTSGYYEFEGLCAGSYTLVVTHIDCLPVEVRVKLEANLVRNFVLPHTYNQLQEIIVQGIVDRQPDAVKTELSKRDIQQTRGLTLGEVLRKADGVTVLQTGSTIFKPVIHGLHSQRVLLLNNGVRQEGQQWGSEHAPEIDPFIADKFTVLKGAGALRYGADAIGGAILVEPRALPRQPGLGGEVNSILFSNNRMGVFNALLEQNLARHPAWSWRAHLTWKKGGNTRTPDYWLHNTGVEELNYSAQLGYKKDRTKADLYFSAFNTKLGIFWGSHIGNTTDLENAINSPRPLLNIDKFTYELDRPRQEVQHYLAKATLQQELLNGHRLNFMLAHQENFRSEYDRAIITNRPELDLNIGTTTLDLNYEQKAAKGPAGLFGLMAQRQENVWDGSRFFIPNFTSWMLGAYAIERWTLGRSHLEAGLRYDHRNQRVFRNQNNVITETFRQFNNLSGTLSWNYKLSDQWRWITNAALAWRPPTINELYVNGLHHGTANFEIGDPNLQSERAWNFSTQFSYRKDSSWSADFTLYSNYIAGFINLIPVVPATLTLRGAYPTFRFIQTNAWLSGADLRVTRDFGSSWQAGLKASLLLPRDVNSKTWLQQMPAQRGELDFTWFYRSGHPRESYLAVNLVGVSRQTLVPDNLVDYLPPPPGYILTNFEYATLLHIGKKHLTFGASIYNAFNIRYRDYMNRFRYFNDEAGRNVVLRIKYPL